MADEVVDLQSLLNRWEDEVSIEEQLRALGGETDPHEWVSLAEAEHRGGVSRSTLRAWYRSGQLPSRLMPGPHGMHRLVPLDAVLERVARSPRPAARGSGGGGGGGSGEAGAPRAVPSAARAAEGKAEQKGAPQVQVHGPASDVVRLAELAVQEARDRAAAAERRAESAEQALREAIERAAAAEAELRALRRS